MIAGNLVIDDAQRARPSKPPLRPVATTETSTRLFGTSRFAAEIESIAQELVQLKDQENEKQWYLTRGHYTSKPDHSHHPAAIRPARVMDTGIDPRSRAPQSGSYPWANGSTSEEKGNARHLRYPSEDVRPPRRLHYAHEVDEFDEEEEYAREDEEHVQTYCEPPIPPTMGQAKWTPSVDNGRINHAQDQMDKARKDVEEAVIDRHRLSTGRPRIRDTLLLYGFES